MTRYAIALLAAVLVVGCATAKPILYSNEKYQQVGKAGADSDIAACKALADQAGATPGAGKGGQVAKGAGVGAVTGAAAGAVGGAIWGNPGAGAAGGAVSGIVGGILWPVLGGSNQPSEVHKNYVNQCLVDRGYQIAGWK
jgi:outer membrane lipoprotein SlyB